MAEQKQSLFEYPVYDKPITVGLRLGSMLCEQIIQCLFILPAFIPSIIAEPTRHSTKPGFTALQYYLWIAGVAIYFCKDCIGGRSIAKRILDLQVADNKTGKVASPLQCLIRNILIIIWPVEVLITFFSPARRLGDRLAGTKIVYSDSIKGDQKINIIQIVLLFILAYAISLAVVWALKKI